jgi:hypothetical protein
MPAAVKQARSVVIVVVVAVIMVLAGVLDLVAGDQGAAGGLSP